MSLHVVPAPRPCLLWQVDLDADPGPRGLALLSDEEWSRARRFAFDRDRRRYLAAHAALRQVLAQHCDMPAASLAFVHGPFGKPELAGQAAGFHFNLSHSGALGLIALHPATNVGVDVETVREMDDAFDLARAHFTEDECDALARLKGAARDRAFLTCWTRKEACLKAVGLGLSLDTRCFHVGIEADSRSVWLPATVGSQRIALASFAPRADAIGALATAYRHGAPAIHRVLDTELAA